MPVDVVIVNYNTRDLLRECLFSLENQHELGRIRVADNGSTDGSYDMVRSRFPRVDVVSLPDNPGFGAAANVLVWRSTSDLVVVLNADVRLEPGALAAFAAHFAAHPEVAVAGPHISESDGSLQRSVFDDPNVRELLWQESGLHRFRRGDLPRFDHATTRPVPWVLGAVMAIRRSAFEAAGGFDPGYFLYYEEVDLCRRLRGAGHEVHFVAEAAAVHHGGSSTGQHAEASQRTLYRSLRRFHGLHGTASIRSLRAAVVIIMGARIVRDRWAERRAPDADAALVAQSKRRTWTAVLRDALRDWPRLHEDTGVHQRRLDWLVLLPEPSTDRPVVEVLGDFTDDDITTIAEHYGIDEVERSNRGGADVLLIDATAHVDIDRALQSVAEGGVAYVSRTRRRLGWLRTPAGLVRSASRSGFTVIGQHWLLPDAASARRHVPLDQQTALRWYFQRLLIPTGRLQQLAVAALQRWPALTAAVAQSHAVVAVRGAERIAAVATMGPDGSQHRPDDRVLVMTSGHDVGSRTVAMIFSSTDDEPHSVVKVSARTAMNETTRREHAALLSLRDVLPPDLTGSVPQPKGLTTWRDRLVSTETLVSGPSLEVELRRSADVDVRIARMAEVAAWVTELHGHTAEYEDCDDDFVDFWFAQPFQRYCEVFDADNAVWELFDRALERLREVDPDEFPVVRRHVDLGPWNIICTAGGLGIIDWETAGRRPSDGRGLPYCDLNYFLKYWLHIVGDAISGPDEISLFPVLDLPPSVDPRYGAAIRATTDAYCRSLHLDPRLVPVLMLHNWVEQALYGSDRDRMLHRLPALTGPTVFIEALARRSDELFGLVDAP